MTMPSSLTKGAAFAALLAALASCGLPRVGPNKSEIFSGSVQREGDSFVLAVDDRVNLIASVVPATGFPPELRNAGKVGSDTIRAGDTLGITIWENVDNGLMTGTGQNATALEQVQVDGDGYIFMPYAGRIRAAGNSPEAIRRIITSKLKDQTPDPQVQVRRMAGDGAAVTILGGSSAQGVFPIERPTRTLSAMIGKAGGVQSKPSETQITLVRGRYRGTVLLQDLFDDPRQDIALRDGDQILIESNKRSFTAMGATGSQSRVPFNSLTLTGIEAIAQVGGLNPTLADPTGVFVFRNEPEKLAEQLTGLDLTGTQRIVYVLDLTKPNGIFLARDFTIRDGDTLYVTEAPLVSFNKSIAAVTGSLSSVDSLATATGAK